MGNTMSCEVEDDARAKERLQERLSSGQCNVNGKGLGGWTPLHEATFYGYIQCAELLLQRGAVTNIQDENGETPLHVAAWCDRKQFAQLLLQHGADTSIQAEKQKTSRMMAEEKEHTAVAELLRRFEIPDIQMYIQTRTLEHVAEILDLAECRNFNLTNLNSNFPEKFQKIQVVKDWIAENNYTTLKDIRDGLQAASLLRLSSAAMEYYAEMVMNIADMSPDEFEALCRTLTTAKYMYTPCATTWDRATRPRMDNLDENEVLRDEVRQLTAKLRQQSQ
ncbi:tankyrase-2-like [Lingula anatina]|uniref:Tankyrase-2-like n=1 Tax=Lingula anatina TaxID=7574 RepID=A0A1S3KG54_LINAN|nr:tankyrase-2-like [Lingula anatina]XP_013421444.1 tankyrase-2-like [Lingula anatina]|eukprot:XP_013421443.1 tankyrase-2-like [Lingula anatina]